MRLSTLLSLLIAAPVAAQGSPFIPLDHPLLPLAEYLIGRGEIQDPSPMIRPFRRLDLVHAIEAAKLPEGSRSAAIAAELLRAFTDRADDDWFRVAARAGVQGYTHARRDLLHPAGDGGVTGYGDLDLAVKAGNLVLATRGAAENRLKDDPDWAGETIQRHKRQAYRFIDGYIGFQSKRVRLFYGQMDRNWGPAGSLGLSIANAAYPRSDIGFDLVFDRLQFNVVGTQLADMTSMDGTTPSKRYFMAHRLNIRATKHLDLAIWETAVLGGPSQSFDPTFRNPLILMAFPIQLGLSDNRNAIVGGDIEWRAGSVRIQSQLMIDDWARSKADPNGTGEPAHPGRWAAMLVGSGPLGSTGLWRIAGSVISSLAYRTIDSTQSFLDQGVGIGPQFPDNYTVTASVTLPVANRWTVSPDVTLLRQGEGRIDAPFPTDQELPSTPSLLLGTVATTFRVGTRFSGRFKGFDLQGDVGVLHTKNADQIPGNDHTRLELRVLGTFGITVGGPLR